MSDTNFAYLHAHYIEALGGYDTFLWKCVPSYIDTTHDGIADGGNMTGRWLEGSYKFSPNAKTWNAEIIFEEDI